MNKMQIHKSPVVFMTAILTMFSNNICAQKDLPPLKLEKTIALPRIHGKFDHMAIDVQHQKLFLAAKGNNSVEVIDLISGKIIHSIKEVSAPQGLLFMQNRNMIVVCNGGDGSVKGFDATTYLQKFVLMLGKEADNIRYSPLNHKIYVAYGDGAIAVIDDKTFNKIEEIPFGAHPEAFSLNGSQNKIWVNLPEKGIIQVVQLGSQKKIATWNTSSHSDNYPMTMIENDHKLIVASRTSPFISILHAETGRLLQTFSCDEDPDAMFYDNKSDRVLISCGGGSIYMLSDLHKSPKTLPTVISTRKGARTCLWVPAINRLFVALPEYEGKEAEIRIYE